MGEQTDKFVIGKVFLVFFLVDCCDIGIFFVSFLVSVCFDNRVVLFCFVGFLIWLRAISISLEGVDAYVSTPVHVEIYTFSSYFLYISLSLVSEILSFVFLNDVIIKKKIILCFGLSFTLFLSPLQRLFSLWHNIPCFLGALHSSTQTVYSSLCLSWL